MKFWLINKHILFCSYSGTPCMFDILNTACFLYDKNISLSWLYKRDEVDIWLKPEDRSQLILKLKKTIKFALCIFVFLIKDHIMMLKIKWFKNTQLSIFLPLIKLESFLFSTTNRAREGYLKKSLNFQQQQKGLT